MLGLILPLTEVTKKRVWIAFFTSVFILTFCMCLWTAQQEERRLSSDLLRRAVILSETLNVNRLTHLSGEASDLEKPQYTRLKRQLVEGMRVYEDIEEVSIYCHQAPNTFRFIVDSNPLDINRDGRIEEKKGSVSVRFNQLHDSQKLLKEGVIARYKKGLVSALVPINDPKRGEFIWVLSLDIAHDRWIAQVAHSCLAPLLLGVILVLLLLLARGLFSWRTRRGEGAYRWMEYLEATAIFVMGMTLTLYAVHIVHQRDRDEDRMDFERLAAKWTTKVSSTLHTLRNIELEGFAKLYECSGYVSDDEFLDYSEHLLQDSAVDAWFWVVSVPLQDKVRFERAVDEMKEDPFVIWEYDPNNANIPVETRNHYYPICQVVPVDGHEETVGFDFGSLPHIRRELEMAAQMNLPTATDVFDLPLLAQCGPSFYVFRAVFEKSPPRGVIGFVAARVRLQALIMTLNTGNEMVVKVTQLSNSSSVDSIGDTTQDHLETVPGLSHVRPVFAFGKTFAVSAQATPSFQRITSNNWSGRLTALIGLLLSSIICLLQVVIMQRRRELEKLVEFRTYNLRKSEEHLAATLRSIDDGVMVCDMNGWVTSLNGVAEILTGWKSTEAQGHDIKEVFHLVNLNTKRELPNLVNRVLETGWPQDTDGNVALISRTGVECPVTCSCNLIRDDQGDISGVVLAFRDVTVHKREENLIRANAERLEAMLTLEGKMDLSIQEISEFALEKVVSLSQSTLGYLGFVNDQENEVTLYAWTRSTMAQCNVSNEPMAFKLETSGLWGDPIRERKAIITNDYEADSPHKRGVPAGHVSMTRHVGVPTFSNGKIVLLLGCANKPSPYTDDDVNQLSLFMQGFWNIIQRKQTEEALRQAKEDAEHAMRIKSEFLANMSHEIRTPINAMIGMNDLLKRTNLTERQQKYVDRVDSSSRLLLQIINDILDLSKMEAGRLRLDLRKFSIDELLEPLRSIFSVLVAEKKIGFHFSVEPQVPAFVVGDHLRLSQVLANLLSNAIKFTEKGSVMLNLKFLGQTHATGKPRYRLRFEVQDTGIGLSDEHMRSIFRPFMQADSSTTRRYGGTGLGLVIAKRWIELMGGQIGVDSVRGKGSTFFFELEMEGSQEPEQLTTEPAFVTNDHKILSAYPDFTPYAVLIVEDNLINQEVIVGLLEVTGIHTVLAKNGLEALERLSDTHCDLILMDLQMPEMDGFEAIQRIRESKNPIPIIALSAAVMESDRLKAKNAGSDDYLAKPIDFAALLIAMERLLISNGNKKTLPLSPQPERQTPEVDNTFPLIRGFDVYRGLGQVNNMPDLYQDILVSFYAELNGVFSSLPQALQQERTVETRRNVHTLKGLAGTVGATRLEKVSIAMNATLKTDQLLLPETIEEFQLALQEVKEGLEAFIQERGLREVVDPQSASESSP